MAKLFDPVQLLSQNFEANATRRDPLPIGETPAQIMELSFNSGTSNKPGKAPVEWSRLDCKLEITDPEYLKGVPGQPDKAITTLGIMLDMNGPDIATGPNKNIRLGRLREACGVNGQPLGNLVGQYLRIAIGHKPHPTEPDVVLDEIVGYTKMA